MSSKTHLSAQEAADALGITLPTLYAYVSRGQIRSESAGDNRRSRRYLASDVERLLARKAAAREPETAAQSAMHWGMPSLDSAITLIDAGKLYYRGRDVVALATNERIETVAALIWDEADDAGLFADDNWPDLPSLAHMPDGGPLRRLIVALNLAAEYDVAAYDLRPDTVRITGARISRLLALAALRQTPDRGPISDMLAAQWRPGDDLAARLLDAALILCADHELNASSFSARVVASAGATPYAAVTAGLAALQGVKHGGVTRLVEAFLHEIGRPGNIRATIADWLQRGERVPGFGQRLYPAGDPRAAALLALLRETGRYDSVLQFADLVVEEVQELLGEAPTIDFALATLAQALELPAGSALTVFAIGRSVGWIGHALEQYADGRLIRPRANYVGPMPT
jgi:citrate synthase